ncbi:hypothetical protein GCM10011445_36270 [Pseudocitrobacter faecalis]|nr:hypothetical protein GCM10011445_36270 [Pseudocitrobacter faecalis]
MRFAQRREVCRGDRDRPVTLRVGGCLVFTPVEDQRYLTARLVAATAHLQALAFFDGVDHIVACHTAINGDFRRGKAHGKDIFTLTGVTGFVGNAGGNFRLTCGKGLNLVSRDADAPAASGIQYGGEGFCLCVTASAVVQRDGHAITRDAPGAGAGNHLRQLMLSLVYHVVGGECVDNHRRCEGIDQNLLGCGATVARAILYGHRDALRALTQRG